MSDPPGKDSRKHTHAHDYQGEEIPFVRLSNRLDGRTLDRGASGGQGDCTLLRKILAERVVPVSLVRMLTLFSSDVKTPFMKIRAVLAASFSYGNFGIFSTG